MNKLADFRKKREQIDFNNNKKKIRWNYPIETTIAISTYGMRGENKIDIYIIICIFHFSPKIAKSQRNSSTLVKHFLFHSNLTLA